MSMVEVLTVAVLVLAALVATLIYVAMRLINELLWTRDDLDQARDAEHAKCMSAVMAFVGDEFAAQVLAVAADDYASAESHSDLSRIGRLLYRPGGPPVPSIWLHERADRLRIDLAAERSSILDEVS